MSPVSVGEYGGAVGVPRILSFHMKRQSLLNTSHLLGSGRQSKVYALWKKRVLKVGRWLHTYRSLWQSVLPRVFFRGRGYMVEERVKTYQEANFRERKILRSVESDFQREAKYISSRTPWYKKLIWSYKVNKKHATPIFQKWGWSSLLRFPLSNFHFGDIKRRNIGIRRGKPVILDEWVIKYKK